MRDDAPDATAGSGTVGRAAWAATVAVAALLAATWHIAGSLAYVSLDRLAAFRETAPFQHRVLVPLLVAAARAVTGVPAVQAFWAAEWLAWAALILLAERLVAALGPSPGPWSRRLIALTVLVPVGVELMAPSRFRAFGPSGPIGDINSVLAATRLSVLPNLFYPWDAAAAALLLALIASLLRLRAGLTWPRLAGYAVLFVLACLNRETAVLIVPFSLWALAPALTRSRLALAAVAQAAAWAVVIAAVAAVTAAPPNPRATLPGGSYEWYLWSNLHTLTHPLYAATVLGPLAAGLWLPVVVWWKGAPAAARALGTWYIVPALAAALAFGVLHETRIFVEAAAATWVAAMLVVHERVIAGGGSRHA